MYLILGGPCFSWSCRKKSICGQKVVPNSLKGWKVSSRGQKSTNHANEWWRFSSKYKRTSGHRDRAVSQNQKNIMLEILRTSCIKGVKNEACLHQHICGEYTHGQVQVNKSLHTPFLWLAWIILRNLYLYLSTKQLTVVALWMESAPPGADLRCFTLLLGHRRLTFYSTPQQSTKKLASKLTATAKSTTDCCWDIPPPWFNPKMPLPCSKNTSPRFASFLAVANTHTHARIQQIV